MSLRRKRRRALAPTLLWLLIIPLALPGCAGYRAYREGQTQLAQGQLEPGLAKLKQAAEESPENVEFLRSYYTQRENGVNAALRDADIATDGGEFDSARDAYARALRLEPGNLRAQGGAARVDVAQRHWTALEASLQLARDGDVDAGIAKTRQVLSENPRHARAGGVLKQLMRLQADRTGKELGIYPKLKATYRMPVSLSFNAATLLQVFEALKLSSGLNYMFDRDVKQDQRITLSVTNKPIEDILRLLLATNQLERRVLDDDTLLIYPNTPAKNAEYREMVARTFYLSNADAEKVATMVRTIVKAKDVVVDDKLNLIVVRDSVEVIRLAEKLIATQDLPDPEVMLELEVLEVGVNRLTELGISWPSSISAGVVGVDGVAGQLRLDEFRNRNSGLVRLNISNPVIAAQLRGQIGQTNVLANPRVRVRNKQGAKILIGERVPVFTTTATANVGTTESVSYLDVGLKLEIEPTVTLDDDVSMKLALEVSNILETITRVSGTQAYRLGTRNTSTTLRVHDGETNILAGLIQTNEQHSNTGIPGLNELPIAGKLFGASQDSNSRTEIVLLVTPHIVRNVEPPGVGLQEFLSGTDASVGAPPIQLGAPRVQSQQPLAAPPAPPTQPKSAATPAAPLGPAPALSAPPLIPTAPGTLPAGPPQGGQ